MIPQKFPVTSEIKPDNKPTSCGSLIGRVVKKVFNVGKTFLIASLAVGLLFAPVAAASEKSVAQNIVDRTRFPPYFARFVHPGEQSARMYTARCDMAPFLDTNYKCNKMATEVVSTLISRNEYHHPMREMGYDTPYVTEQGRRKIGSLMHPQYGENYEKAVNYVQRTFFLGESPFEISPAYTIDYICTVHRILTEGLPWEEVTNPGRYRTSDRMFGSSENAKGYLERAKEVLNPDEHEAFSKMFEKLKHEGGFVPITTQQERDIWGKVGLDVALRPELIDHEMKNFASELLTLIVQNRDPIEIAAYLHMELARITPFTVANGRLMRILLNAILIRYAGIDPVVFSSKLIYNQEIVRAIQAHDYTLFAKYLRNTSIPWTKEHLSTLKHMEPYFNKKFLGDAAFYANLGFAHGCFSHEIRANFRRAYFVAELNILQNPLAFIDSIAATLDDIKVLHKTFSLGINQDGGFYRTDRKIVCSPDISATAKVHLTADEYALFEKSHKEVFQGLSTRGFTEKELVLWLKAGAYVPVQPEQIEREMEHFAKNLLLLVESSQDPLAIAAYAHREISRILPFRKHNGKLARLLLNGILTRFTFGIKPIIFPDKKEYLDMVDRSIREGVHVLYDYLRYQVLPVQKILYGLKEID